MSAEASGGWLKTILDIVYFQSPTGQNVLYFVIALATVGTLAAATALKRVNPDSPFARYAARVTPCYPYLLLQGGVLALIGVQAAVEQRFTAWLGWDFTPLVYRVEGHATEWFQDTLRGSFAGPALDKTLVPIYTWGAFFLFQIPFFVLLLRGRVESLRRLSFTLAIVWAVGLVFYMFVPVWEVWTTADPAYGYNYTHVKNVLIETAPGLLDAAIYQVNLNNNFPSLHTGVSAATFFALWYAREQWMYRVAGPIAAGVIFATVYLGIHWFVDLIAGLALAWGAAFAVDRWERERQARAAAAERADGAEPTEARAVSSTPR